MHKLFLITLLFFILFIIGIAVANNSSIERPLDPYIKRITSIFTKTDSSDSWFAPRPIKPIATKYAKPIQQKSPSAKAK